MSLYKNFKSDADLEKNGVVIAYGMNSKGKPIEFTIARAGGANVRYAKVLDHKIKPYRRMMQNGTLPDDTAMQVIKETFVETILLGWEGVENEDDQPMEFSKENAMQLFNDLPDLFRDLKEQAESAALFRASLLDEEAKN